MTLLSAFKLRQGRNGPAHSPPPALSEHWAFSARSTRQANICFGAPGTVPRFRWVLRRVTQTETPLPLETFLASELSLSPPSLQRRGQSGSFRPALRKPVIQIFPDRWLRERCF